MGNNNERKREREKERLLDERGKEKRESPKQGEREGRWYTVVEVTAPEPWLPYNTVPVSAGPVGSSKDMT